MLRPRWELCPEPGFPRTTVGLQPPQQHWAPWGERARNRDVTLGGQGEKRVPGGEDGRARESKGKGKKWGG